MLPKILNTFAFKKVTFSCLLLAFFFLLISCSQQTISYNSDRGIYQEAMVAYYSNKKQQAIQNLEKIIKDYPNSIYSSSSVLALADANLAIGVGDSLAKSFNYYNFFISKEGSSPYIAYALNQLLIISLKNNEKQVFGYSLKSDRANSYFKDIIDDYYRLYLFYPDSVYFAGAENYYEIAQEILAEHELQVADWYYDNSLYPSAILRYNYLLKHFTNFSKKELALKKLVSALKKVNLTKQAAKLETF